MSAPAAPSTSRSAAQWNLRPHDASAARLLASALHLPPITARVLAARGYADPTSAQLFLAPQLADLHNPFALRDMDRAVARIRTAIAEKHKILLYGDYDVDGTSSVVLLLKTLEMLGAQAAYHVPHRLRDGYGMRPEVIERASSEGIRLIISVDTGIRAGEVVKHANTLAIDVIVTDHHLPEAELPPAVAVLNPNRPDCTYPEKNLCGAAVAFKLSQALLIDAQWPQARRNAMAESLLKLVAIATVADVVPLTGENRIIVYHGLAGLDRTRNIGLRALLKVAGFEPGNTPSAGQVAFRVAPRMNAAGRMDTASDVIELFLTADPHHAGTLAQKLHELNAERQITEAATLEACLNQAVGDAVGLVFAGEGWHKGVVGIVASRLVERYSRPVFVLSRQPESGEATGSGRSIQSFHLLDALESMPHLFTKFGGHAHAAGLTLKLEHLDEFRTRFNAYASAKLTPEDLRPQIAIDAEVELHELNHASAASLLSLAPFGYGNPAPVVTARAIQLHQPPTILKEKHLRFRASQHGHDLMMKAWNFAARLDELQPGPLYDLAFTIEDDAYSAARGYAPWQATLRDFRLCS
jgi:single-stranded-DNA-specific exonuclease